MMRRRTNALLAIVAFLAMLLIVPALSYGAELNLGGGTPLWGTHTDDDINHFDGGWLMFASIEKPTEAKSWLSYGLMYNYTRIEIGIDKITEPEGCYNGGCSASEVSTTHDWLQVHVLGPYAKPTWQMTKRLKSFVMIGMGAMYVDGIIYGDEFGGAGFASAGLGLDITEHLGLGAQILYVKGATSHVDDIDYIAPVATISYRW